MKKENDRAAQTAHFLVQLCVALSEKQKREITTKIWGSNMK